MQGRRQEDVVAPLLSACDFTSISVCALLLLVTLALSSCGSNQDAHNVYKVESIEGAALQPPFANNNGKGWEGFR
jgi:hypothetical protein